MRRNGNPEDWAAVFSNILSGRIPFQITDSDSVPLSDALVVETTEVARYLSRGTPGPGTGGIHISCQTAADIIGTTQQFVSAAVKIGFIEGAVGARNSAIPLDRVLAFQKRFVFNRELLEIFGGHQNLIFHQLRKAGLEPAVTVYRTAAWQRSDIEKLREGLLSPAANYVLNKI